MNTYVLLQLALTLLIAAQGPNVTPELRQEAITVATTAISYANSQPNSSGLALPAETLIPETRTEKAPKPEGFGGQDSYGMNLPDGPVAFRPF